MRKSRRGAYSLDADDAGESSEAVSLKNKSQNNAFRAAMIRSIALGEEQVREVVPHDGWQ